MPPGIIQTEPTNVFTECRVLSPCGKQESVMLCVLPSDLSDYRPTVSELNYLAVCLRDTIDNCMALEALKGNYLGHAFVLPLGSQRYFLVCGNIGFTAVWLHVPFQIHQSKFVVYVETDGKVHEYIQSRFPCYLVLR